ncbi:MAG: lysophospholipid acyltransferase family protein [Cyanobacteria bacterium P01_H01_bin.58]
MIAKIHEPMSTVSYSSATVKPRPVTTSQCSPWLTPLVYFLGQHFVLPAYFQKILIKGQENIPRTGPVIIAPTHRARWDSLIVPLATGRSATGRDLHFMVTADEVTGIQGWFIRRLGGFAVNVRSPTISSLRHGIDLLRQNSMLVIYPEGGIFRDNEVHRLKPGLARLAVQAEASSENLGVQILPMSIRYSSPYANWRSRIEVQIGQPLQVASYLHQDAPKSSSSDCLKTTARALTVDLADALVTLSGVAVPEKAR